MRRLFTGCLLALFAAMPLAALTESAQAPTWSSTRLDRFSGEGDNITIGFVATSPDGQPVSYSATGLPPGLSINATTGLVSGTLALSPAGSATGGAAGVYTNVTITATSSTGASSSYVFDWRVSRFKKGDVFAGVGNGKYRVFSDQGEFKYELTVETAADFADTTGNNYGWGLGTTTGCGFNWVTRKMYFTQFDDDYDPTVAEIDPVPVGGTLVRSPLIRTFRDAGLERGGAATGYPIDSGPESVVFGTDFGPDGALGTPDDVRGAMYVGHALGYYVLDPLNLGPDFAELNADIDDNAIIGTDDWSTFYYVGADGQPLLDDTTATDEFGVVTPNPQRIPYAQGYSMDGFLEKYPGEPWLGQNGLPISPLVQFGRDIQKWLPNGAGGWVRGRPVPDAPLVPGGPPREGYDTHAGWQGSDWLDLASDQRTMFYTSEWGTIYRFDVGPNPLGGTRQHATKPEGWVDADANGNPYPKTWPYATVGPANLGNPSPRVFYALRLLPPGDGSGGVIVAESTALVRLNEAGTIINVYDANVDGWFALNISPDGKSVWSASTQNGKIYRWDIASSRLMSLVNGGTGGFDSGATQFDSNGRFTIDGLCVMGEYTAAQEICGDGIDNDEDGEVDEVCQPIESCSTMSPGDDDGDGLVDSNDPDCPGTVNVCAATGYTDRSVAGYCDRFNYEGDNVSLTPAPAQGYREIYTVSNLPPGITASANGVLSGVPEYATLLNTDDPNTRDFEVLYQVRRETMSGEFLSNYEQSFTWTIENVNRPPVANNDLYNLRPGQSVTFDVTVNDTDVDVEDVLTVTTHGGVATGTLTRSGNSFTFVAPANYVGVQSFPYTISDGHGGTASATVTISVSNQPPVAVDDSVGPLVAGTSSTSFNVLTMGTPDSDPDGDAISVTSFTQPGAGTVAHGGNGQFTWTPPSGYTGVTTFTYAIADPYQATDTATVTITVRNLPPVAVNDSATTAGTQPVTIAVMQNDSDPDPNQVISVTGATTPANGSVVVNANGTITYTANAGFQGTDTFFYTIKDGFGGESTATVTVTVGPPNRFDPCLCASAKASPGEIWPPNHKKTEVVTITDLADPDGGPLDIRILGIYQDEPTDYLGDGDTEIDAGGVGTSTAWVRAERTGNPNVPGNGRVYEIVFEATAQDGSTCRGSVFTGVPHDQGQGNYIVDDGIRYDSTVAGGPIVRNALKVESGLTDADIAGRGFEAKYVAEARIGAPSGSNSDEMRIGPSVGATNDTEDFNWTSGAPAYFLLSKSGDTVEFKLLTSDQFEAVSYTADCANGECNDIFLRAEAGGTGTITLSSLNINGIAINETLTIPVGGEPRALHLSGLSMGEGAQLGGLVEIEWTSPKPAGSTVNFRVMVGSACPTDTGGGGGGAGTPPLARSDSYSTNEDTPLIVSAASGILTNDLTFAGPLSASLVSTTSSGSLSLSADGSFTYTPSTNFNGQDSFTYRVSDGNLFSEPALVTITVNPDIDPPTAVDDSATTNENTAVTIAVTGNDSDPFGAALSISALTQPLNGAAAVSGASIVYTPATGYVGTDTFTYTVTGTEGTATARVTVTVINVNGPPLAANNAYTTAEDTPLTIAAPGILGNDSDPDPGDTLSAVLVAGPAHGTVAQNANGSLVYTPAANYNGADSYTYLARDSGGLDSNVATVSITITAVPDPPVAVDDSYVVSEDGVLQINSPGLKANDTDPDTPPSGLTVAVVTGAQRGSLTVNPDGSFVYTPFPDVTGSDSFVYRLSDGTGSSNATATIAITDEPDPPVAVDDAASASEDTPVTINVLGNDSDPDTPTLTLQSITQPANGDAVIASGQVIYMPDEDFAGQDTFTYTISDGTSTATATVVVTVTSVNDPPVAAPDAYTTPRNTPLAVSASGVLGNDTDPDSASLTAVQASLPANGTVALAGNGSLVYTPNTGFVGVDTFTYHAHDGELNSNTTTVTITVAAVNAAPMAVDDATSTNAGESVSIAVITNDSDPDGDEIAVSTHTSPSNGTVTRSGNVFTYTPNPGYVGTDTFTYTIADPPGATATATVTIIVSEVCEADAGGALVRRSATFHGGGVVEGSVRVLTAADVVFNAQTRLNGDLFIVGTPTVQTYQPVTYGGTVDGTGAATPNSHRVTIYGGAILERVVRRTDAVAMPTVINPPTPTGTRYVQLNNPGDSPGDFATIRDLTLNSSAGTRTIPPGTYGNFTAHAPSTFVLGIAGETTPAVYNFQSLTVNSGSALTVVGPVIITVRNALNAYGSPLGNSAHPEWLTVRVASTNGFRLNSNVPMWGYVEAPNGPVVIDGGAVLTGGMAADTFTLNGQGRLVLLGQPCEPGTPPTANDDAYTTAQDTPLTVTAPGVLTNDTDSEGAALTASLLTQPANGTVMLSGTGAFTYTPSAGFSGVDTYSYRVSNGTAFSSAATVTITVTGANTPPVAVDDTTSTNAGEAVTIAVIGNDSDPDGDTFSVTSHTAPTSGTVTRSGNTFVYTPASGFTGTATFTYTIADANNTTDTATVTIIVSQVCESSGLAGAIVARTAMFDAGGRVEGSVQMTGAYGATFNSNTVLTGDLFVLGRPTVTVNGTPAAYGGIVDGTGSTTPTSHSIMINAGASLGRIMRRTNAVTVPSVASPPLPSGTRSVVMNGPGDPIGSFSTLKDLTLNNNIGPVTVPPGTYGTFIAGPNSSFVIGVAGATTPATYNFQNLTLNAGSSRLTVVGPVILTVRYGATWHGPMGAQSNPEWLDLRVATSQVQLDSQMQFYGTILAPNSDLIVNAGTLLHGGFRVKNFTVNSNGRVVLAGSGCQPAEAPTAQNDAYTTAEDTPLTLPATGVVSNDVNPAGGSLTALLVNGASNGTVTLAATGSFTYTPNANYWGVDTFTYRVSNGSALSNTATVTITIGAVPDPPDAVNDTATTSEDRAVTISVLGQQFGSDRTTRSWRSTTRAGRARSILNMNAFGYVTTASNHPLAARPPREPREGRSQQLAAHQLPVTAAQCPGSTSRRGSERSNVEPS